MTLDDLEQELMHLPSAFFTPDGDPSILPTWKIRNAVEGVQIFGGIGSGKTSGSGRTLALKYLNAGFGGLVLTVKPDEVKLWEEYCRIAGRSKDLVIIKEGGDVRFNFLEYESAMHAGAISQNLHHVLKTVINASADKSGGNSKDPFWDDALDMVLVNLIDLCLLAYDRVTIQDLYDIAQSLPQKPMGMPAASRLQTNQSAKKITAFERAFDAAEAHSKETKDPLIEWRFKVLKEFFEGRYSTLADRTRSVIDFSLSGFLFRLLSEPVFSLFCKDASTVTPDDCRTGKIIVVDLPVKIYHKIGRDSQIMFKYIWQRAMERTNATSPESRVAFLWADEAQHFIHELDADFQATARSSQVATVYLTQNLPNYFANMGGSKYRYRTQSFLGTLATKIFHANADIETNEYASGLIGMIPKVQRDESFSDGDDNSSEGMSFRMQYEPAVRVSEFPGLINGGKSNDFEVEAILHFQGNVLKENKSHARVFFHQYFVPVKKSKKLDTGQSRQTE